MQLSFNSVWSRLYQYLHYYGFGEARLVYDFLESILICNFTRDVLCNGVMYPCASGTTVEVCS